MNFENQPLLPISELMPQRVVNTQMPIQSRLAPQQSDEHARIQSNPQGYMQSQQQVPQYSNPCVPSNYQQRSTQYAALHGIINDTQQGPVPQPAPVPAPQQAPVPAPQQAPVPVPQQASVPVPQQAPVPVPQQAPVPVPQQAPVPVPQQKSPQVPKQTPPPIPTQTPAPVPQQETLHVKDSADKKRICTLIDLEIKKIIETQEKNKEEIQKKQQELKTLLDNNFVLMGAIASIKKIRASV